MKWVKQPHVLDIININVDSNSKTIPRHSVLLPNDIRCIICGPSNCGKTNVMVSMILHRNGLKFKNVYLY